MPKAHIKLQRHQVCTAITSPKLQTMVLQHSFHNLRNKRLAMITQHLTGARLGCLSKPALGLIERCQCKQRMAMCWIGVNKAHCPGSVRLVE